MVKNTLRSRLYSLSAMLLLKQGWVLALPGAAVPAAAGDQLRVAALLGDPSLFQDQDLIKPLQTDQAMGDHQGRAVFHERINRLEKPLFSQRIEVSGRLIQD